MAQPREVTGSVLFWINPTRVHLPVDAGLLFEIPHSANTRPKDQNAMAREQRD
jgi:hypothetical protein